jgi:hypothetical protein
MIYQIVHPFSLAISGETMKDAIKNYAKYNYDMNINQLIVTDKINHMKAKLRYYNENDNKKVKIGMKPTYWNGVGFDSHNRLRIPGLEWPNTYGVNFDPRPVIPPRAVFYPPQPQPVVQPVVRYVAPQPLVQVAPRPLLQVAPRPLLQVAPRVVSTGQPYIYPRQTFTNVGTSDSPITGKADHYASVPGIYGSGIVTPLLQHFN